MFSIPCTSSSTPSEISLVHVQLMADLARILSNMEKNQCALIEQQKAATEQQRALVEQQKVNARQQAEQQNLRLEQQKIIAGCALRNELRSINSCAKIWHRLPLLNGDPLPEDIRFPTDVWTLQRFTELELLRLAEAYGIEADTWQERAEMLRTFIAGPAIL